MGYIKERRRGELYQISIITSHGKMEVVVEVAAALAIYELANDLF